MPSKFSRIFSLDNLPFFKGLNEQKSNNTPLISTSPFFLLRGLDGSTFAFRTVSLHQMLRNYREIAPVNTAVNKIADAVGGLSCVLIDKKTEEKVREHDLLKLLDHPNADTQKTKRDFLRDITIWKILAGNAYISARGPINRPPTELFVFNPSFITPLAGDDGFIGSYRHTSLTFSEIFIRQDDDRFIDARNMAELYDISSFNPEFNNKILRGVSKIESLFFEINQYLFAAQHNLALLGNGARPSGVFVMKNRKDGTNSLLNPEQYERLKNEIQNAYIGSNNAGRPMILEGGMEFQQTSLTATDMDFKALKDDAEKQIYKNMGVPIELVMAEGTTFSNMGNVRMSFYENNVIPFTEDILLHLQRFLLPRYPDRGKFRLAVDKDLIEVLAPARAIRREIIEKSIVLTVNEKRKELNLPPIEGGDKITDPNGRPIAGPDAGELVGGEPTGDTEEEKPENEENDEENEEDTEQETEDET